MSWNKNRNKGETLLDILFWHVKVTICLQKYFWKCADDTLITLEFPHLKDVGTVLLCFIFSLEWFVSADNESCVCHLLYWSGSSIVTGTQNMSKLPWPSTTVYSLLIFIIIRRCLEFKITLTHVEIYVR